ncbi:MAG: single-stranded DNA-binding protein [Deltaproteobacteria bacterium]|nr:single-stranded DNA-binding protein [Deltaproteobacteria bacterium]
MGLNRVFLLGNLGADPELRYTGSQMPVCTLNVATGEKRKSPEGEWVDHTEWHSVVVWGKQAENCSQYLAKGRQVFVEGRIQTKKWQDQEGRDRYKTEVIASNIQFVGGRGEAPANQGFSRNIEKQSPGFGDVDFGGSPTASSSKEMHSVSFDDDDIPF